jgi:N-acetylmuramoyl-L-alanine amidase
MIGIAAIAGVWLVAVANPSADFRAAAIPLPEARQSQPSGSPSTATNTQIPAIAVTAQTAPATGRVSLPIVVLDPGHGGTDSGARSESSVQEKDLTLMLAKWVRGELERNGYRVVMTRDGDQDPSFDDRSAVANAHRDAIFLSLHVGSTGTPGTVRAYVYPAVPEESTQAESQSGDDEQAGRGLVEWDRAQQPFVGQSRKLGDLLQTEFSQRFAHSPELSTVYPIRDLRSVTAPAAAIEISSVAAPDADMIAQMGPSLAAGIARAVAAFQPPGETGVAR